MSVGAPARGGVGGLSARVSALERALTNLAQQVQRQAGSESLSPNYLTANAAGQVGANFTGLVNALGLILPTALSGFQPPTVANNQIVWEDSGNGALIANIQGFANDAGTTSGINVGSKAEANAWQNYASLNANSHAAPSASASLQISQQNEGATGPTGNIGGWTEIDAFVGTQARMLLDAAGRSSWLQVATPSIPQNTVIGFSILQGTWPGGQFLSVGFSHFQATPTNALYFPVYINTSGTIAAFCYVQNATTSGCTVVADNPSGAVPAGTGYGIYLAYVLEY